MPQDVRLLRLQHKRLHKLRRVISLVITGEGKVKDARILRGLGYGIDKEVLRVINLMPDWIPGKKDGKNVDVQFNLPVYFNLK